MTFLGQSLHAMRETITTFSGQADIDFNARAVSWGVRTGCKFSVQHACSYRATNVSVTPCLLLAELRACTRADFSFVWLNKHPATSRVMEAVRFSSPRAPHSELLLRTVSQLAIISPKRSISNQRDGGRGLADANMLKDGA